MEWWAETDRIRCSTRDGKVVEVIVRQRVRERKEGLVFGRPTYATESGEPLKRVEGGSFQLANGESFRACPRR